MNDLSCQYVVSKLVDLVGDWCIPMRFCIVVIMVASVGLQSCSRGSSDSVTLFVASSVVESMQEIKESYENSHPEIRVELVSAGSQVLAMQIIEGAPADIFISADIRQMNRIQGFDEPSVLVENGMVAIVGLGSIANSVEEAIAQASRIVLAHEAVPAGQYTLQALTMMGLWEDTESKVYSYEQSVNGVVAKVVMGQADLGFVYKTDALNETDSVRIIEFPDTVPVTTQIWIAQITESNGTTSPESSVYQYIMESHDSNRIFSRHGFQLMDASP